MIRKISISDLKKAVDEAYEKYKSIEKGEIDPRLDNVDPKAFGISVMLADGTVINKGYTKVKSPLGHIANLAIHSLLLQQLGVKELVKKAGKVTNCALRAADIPVCPHAVRAYSAVEPQNDPDGKYDLIINNILNMTGSAPNLDDKLYEKLVKEADDKQVVNKFAQAGYTLYDDAEPSVRGFVKLEALQFTAEQIANFGATIAADGVNPVTNTICYDGALSAPLVTLAAIHGDADRNRRWLMKSGVPAVYSFGGLILAIMPGVGAIAAYAPAVGKHGRSKKGARAIRYITRELGYNVFGSARIEFVKD